MARIVVLSFEDNEEAEAFADAVKFYVADRMTNQRRVFPEVLGLFAYPTLFCESSGSGGCRVSGRRVAGWTRGLKYGWWVCAVCKKPSGFNKDSLFRSVVSQGVNFRDRAQKVELVSDEGWGVSGR